MSSLGKITIKLFEIFKEMYVKFSTKAIDKIIHKHEEWW